ncbi:hypothetical protein V8J88_00040 [Massilia sp. W12]|uniref:hypothetical protein n=1 Tax=Massilia sp. W12 TaxID=3126507 RepID=UPI0030D4F210
MHLQFRRNGMVRHLSELGKRTIDVLNLNHDMLVEDRKMVIARSLQPLKSRPYISRSQAQRLLEAIFMPDQQGCLPEYCGAVHNALLQYLKENPSRSK